MNFSIYIISFIGCIGWGMFVGDIGLSFWAGLKLALVGGAVLSLLFEIARNTDRS